MVEAEFKVNVYLHLDLRNNNNMIIIGDIENGLQRMNYFIQNCQNWTFI